MARVTGIGGGVLKEENTKKRAVWYAKHLNVALSDYGGITFRWSDEVPKTTGATAWALFPETSKNFGTGPQTAMINYRVDDLDGLLAQMEKDGVTVDPKRDDYGEFGKFGWITDL